MAGMFSKGAELILDTLTNKSAYALPTLYVALTTTTPTFSSAGTEITTSQYGGYARQALVGSSWSGASSGSSTYNALTDWGAASSSTGTNVLGIAIYDALTSGNCLWWENLTSITVSSGTHISFASGQFVASMGLVSGGVGYSTTYSNKFIDHMTGKTTFGAAPSLYLGIGSTAATTTTIGTELPYTGYGTRPQLLTASVNAATIVGSNVDVVTSAQVNFPQDTGGTQTAATYFYVMDAATAGNLIAGGTVTNGAVSNGITPDVPSASTIFRLN